MKVKIRIKKPIYKRWWFWAVVVCLLVGLANPDTEPAEATPTISTNAPAEIPTIPQAEAPTEQVSNQFDGYAEISLADFRAKVEELGYTATYYNQGFDYTEILGFYSDEDCDSLYIVNVLEDPNAKNVVVEILPKPTE